MKTSLTAKSHLSAETCLPVLIFGNNHKDPATPRILEAITPLLRTLGYTCFFDEAPDYMLIENRIEIIEDREADYQEYLKKFNEYQLCISDRNDLKKFVIRCLEKTGLSAILEDKQYQESIMEFAFDCNVTISRHLADLSYKRFFHSLVANKMAYQGIDMNLGPLFLSEIEALDDRRLRDAKMADACLEASQPVFGNVGLFHVYGMQKRILKQMVHDKARTKFCFFYTHSEAPSDEDDHFESRVRSGKIAYPLGITMMDAALVSQDEVINVIFEKIIKLAFAALENERSMSQYEKEAIIDLCKVQGMTFDAAVKKVICFDEQPCATLLNLVPDHQGSLHYSSSEENSEEKIYLSSHLASVPEANIFSIASHESISRQIDQAIKPAIMVAETGEEKHENSSLSFSFRQRFFSICKPSSRTALSEKVMRKFRELTQDWAYKESQTGNHGNEILFHNEYTFEVHTSGNLPTFVYFSAGHQKSMEMLKIMEIIEKKCGVSGKNWIVKKENASGNSLQLPVTLLIDIHHQDALTVLNAISGVIQPRNQLGKLRRFGKCA